MNDVPGFPPRLTVRTTPLPDCPQLLDILPTPRPLAWIQRGEGLVGWGEAARLRLPAEDGPSDQQRTARFARARAWFDELLDAAHVQDTVERPGCGPVAFGSFTFDPASAGSVLIVPQIIVGRRDGQAWITTVVPRTGTEVTDAPAPSPELVTGNPAPLGLLRWTTGALGPRRWVHAVAAAVRRIQRGELDKVVLARDQYAHAADTIDLRTVLKRLTHDFDDCYTFAVDGLVGATPELLLRRAVASTNPGVTGADATASSGRAATDTDTVSSLVLAGTRPRGASDTEDEKLADELCASIKDAEEHRYAVESLRETLAPLCADITVPGGPELLRLRNVQHLASAVRARLRPDTSTLDVVAALHPTAAVGGTPTGRALELIRELEGMDRGRYAGPVGWIDAHGAGEWGIALRSALVEGSSARLFAGCGIVAGSDPEAELAEAGSKFRVMRGALSD
ncbi:chorismate-binding protein [Lipingzhangella sp. LS1_29]|uniref:Chorismate-binding protein n=1 Tax=Lipingzhangella rawalii TaxID=2055835 RepID=A0ABU2H102_9ACTN|nr:chorismate-binding protein [Lipingzhangella rawalii]MDS1268981.1 chorismate-binding protein [Lipingzhangella rawalii]